MADSSEYVMRGLFSLIKEGFNGITAAYGGKKIFLKDHLSIKHCGRYSAPIFFEITLN